MLLPNRSDSLGILGTDVPQPMKQQGLLKTVETRQSYRGRET